MTTPQNPPAFPRPASTSYGDFPVEEQSGMSLRDWFAGKAMEGAVLDTDLVLVMASNQEIMAIRAYEIADAMLKARERQSTA